MRDVGHGQDLRVGHARVARRTRTSRSRVSATASSSAETHLIGQKCRIARTTGAVVSAGRVGMLHGEVLGDGLEDDEDDDDLDRRWR